MGKIIDSDEFLYNLTHWYDKHGFAHELGETVFDVSEIEEAIERTEEWKGEEQ